MAQYRLNLGSQESAIVIGPVSPFASVKCWPNDGSLCRLLKFTDLEPKLGPVSALSKPIVTFTMASSSESRKARVRLMDGHVSLLPLQTILEQRKPKFGTVSACCCAENKCCGQSLGQNWSPSAYRSYHCINGAILATDLR